MKRIIFPVALLAAISFSACSGDNTNTTEATAGNTEMQHNTDESETMMTSVVVETPDYTNVAEPMKTQVSALVDAYLHLKNALIEANAENAKTAANNVLAVVNAMPVATLEGKQKQFAEERTAQVKENASKIAAAATIEAQRASLEPLSEATFAMTKAFDATDQKLYYQHCPMANNNKGGYWLSSTEEIRNPYMGERMLTCGSNEEVLN